jgi:hypothetical protein
MTRQIARQGYDPVPGLAALIDGMREIARSGGDPAVIGDVLTGPYAALRGGLLPDEPRMQGTSTGEAIRECLTGGGRQP